MSDAVRFEDRIMLAIVDRFFEPMPPVISTDYQGNVSTYQQEAPLASVARAIYASKEKQITAAVADKLSVEALAEALSKRITDDIVTRMTGTGGWRGQYDKDREAMRRMVNERIADELARRALAKIDADLSAGGSL